MPEFETFFEVSDSGRVRSLPRIISRRDARGGVHPFRVRGKIIAQVYNHARGGHAQVVLTVFGKQYMRYVHRLVCEAFHGCPPQTDSWALHKNGNEQDNRKENIYWGDRADNAADAIKHGVLHKGEGHNFSKLTEAQARRIKTLLSARAWVRGTDKKIAAKIGCTKEMISNIRRGITWKHVK